MKRAVRLAALTIAACAGLGGLAASIVVYWGLYDVSATGQHTTAVYRLLEVALRRSVQHRTADITVPALDEPERGVRGFRLFDAHCVQCHGAPGVAPQDFALGMRPAPAALVASVRHWSAADIFWVIRHGIKMSGMPAWQYRLSDEQIWDLVAFMKTLPTLTPGDYQAWVGQYADSSPLVPATKAPSPDDASSSAGDVAAGRKALQQYRCFSCHIIPGIVGADFHVGPSLAGIAQRRYIAGVLPNTPKNMRRWLLDPKSVDPLTAMPDLNLSDQDARDIAAFLSTLTDPD